LETVSECRLSEANVEEAGDQLARKVEREGTGKRIVLSGAATICRQAGRGAVAQFCDYRGHPASAHTVVPYEIVIEHE